MKMSSTREDAKCMKIYDGHRWYYGRLWKEAGRILTEVIYYYDDKGNREYTWEEMMSSIWN